MVCRPSLLSGTGSGGERRPTPSRSVLWSHGVPAPRRWQPDFRRSGAGCDAGPAGRGFRASDARHRCGHGPVAPAWPGCRTSAAANEPPDLRKRPGLCDSVPCSTGAAVWPALARARPGSVRDLPTGWKPVPPLLQDAFGHSRRLSSLAAAAAARIWAFALKYCFKKIIQGFCLPEWWVGDANLFLLP